MNDLLQLLNDPHARHSLLVHFPIALSIFGVLPLIALALTKFKSNTLKLVCVACFGIASISGYFAMDAGEDSIDHIFKEHLPKPTQVEKAAMHDHAELGEVVWIWSLVPVGLIGVSLIPKRKVAVIAGSLGLVAGLAASVQVGLTGHAGGKLVYVYGLGVPERGEAVNGVLPEHHHDADEDEDHEHEHADVDHDEDHEHEDTDGDHDDDHDESSEPAESTPPPSQDD